MKKERKLLYLKCRGSGHTQVDPLSLFRIPDDLQLLADSLHLPVRTVEDYLSKGGIPIRRAVDRLGRSRGPFVVLLGDALESLRGSTLNT
jgi:hypothetical protein